MSPLSSGPSRVPCKLFILWYHWELLLVYFAWGKRNAAGLWHDTQHTHANTHRGEDHTHTHTYLWNNVPSLRLLLLAFTLQNIPVGAFYFHETHFLNQDVCVHVCVCEALFVHPVSFLLSAFPWNHVTLLCRVCKRSQIWSGLISRSRFSRSLPLQGCVTSPQVHSIKIDGDKMAQKWRETVKEARLSFRYGQYKQTRCVCQMMSLPV